MYGEHKFWTGYPVNLIMPDGHRIPTYIVSPYQYPDGVKYKLLNRRVDESENGRKWKWVDIPEVDPERLYEQWEIEKPEKYGK